MKCLPVLAALVLVAAPLATRAAEPINLKVNTARDLAEICGTNPKEAAADAKINFCHGFAQGAVDVAVKPGETAKPPAVELKKVRK